MAARYPPFGPRCTHQARSSSVSYRPSPSAATRVSRSKSKSVVTAGGTLRCASVPEPTTITTDDGLTLEAELAPADRTPRAGMVLCHPHPQYGGSMRSLVISALFDALPAAGVTCLRFNFRGVENSEGFYDEG